MTTFDLKNNRRLDQYFFYWLMRQLCQGTPCWGLQQDER